MSKANVPATQQASDLSADFATNLADMAGAGTEGMRTEDLLMPRLTILQALSPQVNERKSEYVEGAKIGLILNTATNKLFSSVHFLPVAYQRRHIEWKLNRGGLVNDYGTDDSIIHQCEPAVDDKGRNWLKTPKGNELVIAGTWYGLNLDDESSQGFIAMSSTQMKASRRWLTMATSERIRDPRTGGQVQPPLLYRSYVLSAVPQNKDQHEWFGWSIKPDKNIEEIINESGNKGLLIDARNLFKAVSEGSVVARAEAFGEERETEDTGTF